MRPDGDRSKAQSGTGQAARRCISRALKWLTSTGPRRFAHGLSVSAPYLDPEEAESGFQKVAAALELIALHSPGAYRHVRQSVAQIVIAGRRSRYWGYYLYDLEWCLLAADWIQSDVATPPVIAMTIVHEATHGRLHRLGIQMTDENRIRVERLCMKAEIAFAGRLPGGEALRKWAQQIYDDAESIWPDNRLRKRWSEWLRKVGVPRWFFAPLDQLAPRQGSAEHRAETEKAQAGLSPNNRATGNSSSGNAIDQTLSPTA